jgi:hypothetical protein
MPQNNAAGQIWPHLQSGVRPEVKQRERSLGDAMWPSLSREAKAKARDQALWDAINDHNRRVLRRGLREAAANLREGRR